MQSMTRSFKVISNCMDLYRFCLTNIQHSRNCSKYFKKFKKKGTSNGTPTRDSTAMSMNKPRQHHRLTLAFGMKSCPQPNIMSEKLSRKFTRPIITKEINSSYEKQKDENKNNINLILHKNASESTCSSAHERAKAGSNLPTRRKSREERRSLKRVTRQLQVC